MHTIEQLSAALAGRYAIDRLVGEGGMATVYLARDIKHNRRVAVKVLNPDLGAVVGVDRFLAEIQVTANLQHPNLLPLFDSGAADGVLFYVMPFIEGESLRARIEREKQLPVEDAVHIAVAVASALDYAHRQGVIHRDLKPENILLHEEQPLIADFGIALALSNAGGSRITQTGLSLGTPQYMSPEQATGDRAIDARTDQYSLGAVTYEMLTGEAPHTGSTSQAVIARVLTEVPRKIRASRPSVPSYVEHAVARALAKLPADRWNTAREFADALQGRAVAPGLPPDVSTIWTTNDAGRRPATARLRDPLVLVLGALAVASLLVAAWQWTIARRDEPRSAVHIQLAFAGLEAVTDFNTATSAVAMSADGRLVAYTARRATGDAAQVIFVHNIEDGTTKPVAGTAQGSSPFFSPDGRSIGFLVANELRRVQVDGGTPTVLARVQGNLWGASWATTGIVYSLNGWLWTMPPSGGTPRPIPDADSADGMGARWPHLLADGKTVLYARGPAAAFLSRSRIAITTISGGRSTILDLPGTSPLGVIDGQLIYASTSGALFSVPVDISGRRGAGAPVQVLSAVGFNASSAIAKASLSATGSLTYQPRTTTSHLVLVSPGGASRLLLKDAKGFSNPRFSPDGKLVAVGVTSESGTDVWILDVAAGTLGRLTSAGATNGYPEWSPDGRRVVFRSDRGTSSSLWWQPVDGSGAAELLLRSGTDDVWEGMVSPDGKWLLYRTGSVGAADIWYRQRSGDTASHPVATTPASEWAARLSPDGHWVAYSSNESGTTQVYVRPFPGPGGRVQVSVEGGETPVWSRDGHHLYYAYGQQLVDASVTTSAPFAVTTRQLLFNSDYLFGTRSHSNYDVTQDGKQFLFLKPVGSDAQVLVIHDWKYELRANRAATGRAR